MTFIKEFPSSVIEKLGYYVYLLLEPENGQVFYVGKGAGNRIFDHIKAALKDETPSDKPDKIRAIRASGREVNHIVHRHGLTEKEAFEVEAALIDFIGLSGLTNQVQGYNSDDRGRMTVAEVVAKYQAPVVRITEPVILITVNRLYKYGMDAERLYEITRGKWVIGIRRNEAKYAFTVFRGIIREVYEIERWLPTPVEKRSTKGKAKQRNRWQFEGKPSEPLQRYIGASTENYQVLGAQNPIRYVNC